MHTRMFERILAHTNAWTVARMHEQTRVCIHARSHAYVHALKHLHANELVHACMWARTHASVYTCTYTCIYTHARTHTCVHARTYVCTNAPTHACTHTLAGLRSARAVLNFSCSDNLRMSSEGMSIRTCFAAKPQPEVRTRFQARHAKLQLDRGLDGTIWLFWV